ncbi:hypothetical protein KKH50_02590, partial [Patescibacteria group bacterium]|nr:hypothetical protein [Patescibacteria group bacterium]
MTFGRLTTQLKKLLKANWFYFWVFFLFFIAIRFYPFLLGKTLVYGDNYSLMIPGKIFTAEYIKQGILPLWNPYIFSGMPWIADINQSVLYPSTLLFIFFSPAIALNFLLIIHALIAYSGMYFLAKKYIKNNLWSLLAGSLWMFSTQISGSMNNFSTLQSLVWLPWLGYFGLQLINKNQAKFLFALVITLQFLGGYPQHVLYGIGLAVLLSVNDNSATFIKWLKAWLVTASLTLAMSAVAWLPFAEVLFNSTRMEQTSEQALVGSLNPIMLIKFVLPYFFDNPSAGVKWGPAWSGQPNVGIYMTWLGWTAIIASFISLLKICKKKKKQNLILKKWQREVIFFATISISTLIFSLGEYLPGFNIIQKYLPLFRIARYPSMVMIVTNLVIILWAVKALKNWQVSYNSYKWLMRLGLAALAVGLVGFGVKQYWFNDAWRIFNSWSSYILSKSVFHTLDRD